MVRNRYLVCYDVSDPERCQKTYKMMQGYGDHVQYSVFMCELNAIELTYLKRDLTDMLNLNEDRALIVDAGPIDGQGRHIYTMGVQKMSDKEPAIII